jgi:hypothetical protein
LGRCVVVNGLLMTSPSVLSTVVVLRVVTSPADVIRAEEKRSMTSPSVFSIDDVIRAAETRSMTSLSVLSIDDVTVFSGGCTNDVRMAWVPQAP